MVEWELTERCNYRCAHCYADCHGSNKKKLDTQEALTMARTLAEAGCRSVTLSGGEPTLRSDWPIVAQALTRWGVGVQLFTNGYHIDAEQARLAKETGVRFVFVSLDGMKKSHDRIRRRCGAFEKALQAIIHMKNQGVAVGINTTVLSPNRKDLSSLSVLVKKLQLPLWTVWLGIPTKNKKAPVWLEEKQIPSLIKDLGKLQKDCPSFSPGDNLRSLMGGNRLPPNHTHPNQIHPNQIHPNQIHPNQTHPNQIHPNQIHLNSRDLKNSGVGGCPAGLHTLGLRSDGTVTLCHIMGKAALVGDLMKESPETIWSRARKKKTQLCLQARGNNANPKHLLVRHPCHATRLAYGPEALVSPKTSPATQTTQTIISGNTKGTLRQKTACLVMATGLATSPLACGNMEKTKTHPRPAQKSHSSSETTTTNAQPPTPDFASPDKEEEKKHAIWDTETIRAETPPPRPPAKKRAYPSSRATMGRGQIPHSCCYSHMLVPGCRCGYNPVVKKPVKKTKKP